ncbi:MAG: uroporphyrinogen-III C-methyltransferase [Oscillibacter sp.]|nr:uroporphyrinogen-III C-methyltransferase [Oscillibacter sp.]
MTGKVWFVGAGPGDAGLLTLRGKQVLERADAVVCDATISPGVRALIPGAARVIDAGKRGGRRRMSREAASRVLLEEALAGNKVVRLEGGDPFLFGSGGEEAETLSAHGVPFEVVPGVSSAFAVPAYFGIPVTRRDCAAGVHIVAAEKGAIDYETLARLGGTLVFLSGEASLAEICAGLLDAGTNPDTPAAVLSEGTTARQNGVFAALSELEAACPNPAAPAIIVVGEVCKLAERLAWYDKRPLAGLRLAVTRPKGLSGELAERLRERGAEVLELPALETAPIPDNRALSNALRDLRDRLYDWIVFTSPTGVRTFFDAFFENDDTRILSGVRIAALGPATREALRKRGLQADFMPSAYDGASLGWELLNICEEQSRILIPRAAKGNRELINALRHGDDLSITEVPVYETRRAVSRNIDVKALPDAAALDYVLFTSESAVRAFAASVRGADFSKIRAVCAGEKTASRARSYGMRVWTAEEATLDALADCVEIAAAERQ